MVDAASPIVLRFFYSDNPGDFPPKDPPIFNVSNMAGGGGGGGGGRRRWWRRGARYGSRHADDGDIVVGRAPSEIPEDPHAEVWEATPLTDEQLRNPST